MNVLFNLTVWKSLKYGQIIVKDSPEEFQAEKDILNDYLREFIFNKYKYSTATYHIYKRTNGYSLKRCCKSYWYLNIDINKKSAHLEKKFMCEHKFFMCEPSSKLEPCFGNGRTKISKNLSNKSDDLSIKSKKFQL